MRQILREPLFHFAVIGVALFTAAELVRRPVSVTPNRIVVSAGTIRNFVATFKLKWSRPPSARELDGLIADRVKEEIYYREARKIGLDRQDIIIRRRLRQKFEFLLQDRLANPSPSEAELRAYLKKHARNYRTDDRYAFIQIYLNPARRGNKVVDDVRRLVAKLKASNGPVDYARLSDPFMLPVRFKDTPRRDVARAFGRKFAVALGNLPPNIWVGPIRSAFGLHIVRVSTRARGRVPPLAKIRVEVERDWRSGRRRAAAKAFYKRLRSQYSVVIERRGKRTTGLAAR